jgi:hypothetical protein
VESERLDFSVRERDRLKALHELPGERLIAHRPPVGSALPSRIRLKKSQGRPQLMHPHQGPSGIMWLTRDPVKHRGRKGTNTPSGGRSGRADYGRSQEGGQVKGETGARRKAPGSRVLRLRFRKRLVFPASKGSAMACKSATGFFTPRCTGWSRKAGPLPNGSRARTTCAPTSVGKVMPLPK